MRYLFLILFLLPSLANATSCTRPVAPKFPDAKTATADAVMKLDQEMQKYSAATNAYVACLSGDASEAQKEAAKTITSYNNDFLATYNKRVK
jgi:hypothetical protein